MAIAEPIIGGPVALLDQPGSILYGMTLYLRRGPEWRGRIIYAVINASDLIAPADADHWLRIFASAGFILDRRYTADSDWLSVDFVFEWIAYRDLYIPRHWKRLGIERCAALCRILGPNEFEWPKEHWNAILDASRYQDQAQPR